MASRSALVLALLGLAAAPAALRAQEMPVVLDYYDELNRVVAGDSLTYYLTGNVRAHRGPIHMRSQRAVVYRRSGVADFTVNVHFWDETTELFADHLIYFEELDHAVATGSVQVVDRATGSQLKADSVHYDRGRGLLTALPRPQLVLVPRDPERGEPFQVWANEMRFTSDSVRTEVVAVRRVLVERSDLTAIGDSLYYDDAAGRAALRQSPQIETRETYISGQRIDILLDQDQRMEALIAMDAARAVDKRDSVPGVVAGAFGDVSPSSFMEGDSLHVDILDERVRWIAAEGRARSLHYTRESSPGPEEVWSVNYLTGQRLRLLFRGDSLDQVVATGGHRGIYRSERVRMTGPRQVPSEPIPMPAEPRTVSTARRPRRRPWLPS